MLPRRRMWSNLFLTQVIEHIGSNIDIFILVIRKFSSSIRCLTLNDRGILLYWCLSQDSFLIINFDMLLMVNIVKFVQAKPHGCLFISNIVLKQTPTFLISAHFLEQL